MTDFWETADGLVALQDDIDSRATVSSADELLDIGGYLNCGCHGTQREHTCEPLD